MCNSFCDISPNSSLNEKYFKRCDKIKTHVLFISLFNQLDAQNLFHNKFYFTPLHVSSTCAHHQEVKIALHSLWYHHTYRWPSRVLCIDDRLVCRSICSCIPDARSAKHKQKHVLCSIYIFFKNRAVYDVMWKNMIEPDRSHMHVLHMRIACCITKATNTHLE